MASTYGKESRDLLPLSGKRILAVCVLPIIEYVLLYPVSTTLENTHNAQFITAPAVLLNLTSFFSSSHEDTAYHSALIQYETQQDYEMLTPVSKQSKLDKNPVG